MAPGAPSTRRKMTGKQYRLMEKKGLVMTFLREHPDLMDEVIAKLRNEKIKKLKK